MRSAGWLLRKKRRKRLASALRTRPRLHQATRNPKAQAEKASQPLDETKRISAAPDDATRRQRAQDRFPVYCCPVSCC